MIVDPGSLPPALDPVVVVIVAAVLVGLLAGLVVLTLGLSIYAYGRRIRRGRVRMDLQSAMLDRLYGSDEPAWDAWVDGLSRTERTVLEDLLDDHLRRLEGEDADELRRLGEALGIPDRARRHLAVGGRYARLRALTWLTLLRDPPTPEETATLRFTDERERAALARARHVSGRLEDGSDALDLLFADVSRPFSVFGLDTLYRIARAYPSALPERAADEHGSWPPAVFAQVLMVCRHLETSIANEELDWIVDGIDVLDARTRVEAIRALAGFGWRSDVREAFPIEVVAADPSAAVRAALYGTLGTWGDEAALSTLLDLALEEPDERAAVAAASALVEHESALDVEVPPSLSRAWAWAGDHHSYDRIAQRSGWSRGGSLPL